MLLVVIAIAVTVWLPALVLVPLLALPVGGLYRIAGLITRAEPAAFHDFLAAMRHDFLPILGLGALIAVLAAVFTGNVFIGLDTGPIVGWLFSAFALYADIGLAMFVTVCWPILLDPLRQELPVRRRLWLAALVALARPGRILALTAVVLLIVVVSTVLFAAVLTVSIAYISLVTTRYVLPAADRLEGRPTKLVVG